jgi:hypothetical protein
MTDSIGLAVRYDCVTLTRPLVGKRQRGQPRETCAEIDNGKQQRATATAPRPVVCNCDQTLPALRFRIKLARLRVAKKIGTSVQPFATPASHAFPPQVSSHINLLRRAGRSLGESFPVGASEKVRKGFFMHTRTGKPSRAEKTKWKANQKLQKQQEIERNIKRAVTAAEPKPEATNN